jgi:hypothetical protein
VYPFANHPRLASDKSFMEIAPAQGFANPGQVKSRNRNADSKRMAVNGKEARFSMAIRNELPKGSEGRFGQALTCSSV